MGSDGGNSINVNVILDSEHTEIRASSTRQTQSRDKKRLASVRWC